MALRLSFLALWIRIWWFRKSLSQSRTATVTSKSRDSGYLTDSTFFTFVDVLVLPRAWDSLPLTKAAEGDKELHPILIETLF